MGVVLMVVKVEAVIGESPDMETMVVVLSFVFEGCWWEVW